MLIHYNELQIVNVGFAKYRLDPRTQNSYAQFHIILHSRKIIDVTISELSHWLLWYVP